MTIYFCCCSKDWNNLRSCWVGKSDEVNGRITGFFIPTKSFKEVWIKFTIQNKTTWETFKVIYHLKPVYVTENLNKILPAQLFQIWPLTRTNFEGVEPWINDSSARNSRPDLPLWDGLASAQRVLRPARASAATPSWGLTSPFDDIFYVYIR